MMKKGRLDVEMLVAELQSLLSSGANIVEAVEVLKLRTDSKSQQFALAELSGGLRSGKVFSEALTDAAPEVSSVLLALVKAHERTGQLATAFATYKEYRDKIDATRQKLVTSLLYPCLLLMVGGGVLLYLALYILPKFARIFSDLGRDLPAGSAILFEFGQWISSKPTTVTGLLLIGIAWLILAASYRPWRQAVVLSALGLPGVSKWFFELELGRLYRTQGLLMKAGLTAVEAIDLSALALSELRKPAAKTAALLVRNGHSVTSSLERANLATPTSARLLGASEGSGNLGRTLESCAQLFEDDAWRKLERATRLFEPMLMVVLGVAIGTIIILMYLPIFEIAGVLD